VFKKTLNNDYHKFSIIKADDFKNVVECDERYVAVKLNLNVQKQIKENHKKFIPIVSRNSNKETMLTTSEATNLINVMLKFEFLITLYNFFVTF